MILCIADVLAETDVATVQSALNEARFVDGKVTAGWHARLVKDNQQADGNEHALVPVRRTIHNRLTSHRLFTMAARPKRLTPLLFSRYEPGMAYGSHVDDALMDGARTDVSYTLFISPPESYEGGALVVDTTAGEQPFKLKAGSIVMYPSGNLHRVEPVTAGVRLAAVGWVRSYIRDPAERELLFDLDTARHTLFKRDGKTAAFDLLSKCSSNLLRRWADD